MPLLCFAFIVKGPGYLPGEHCAEIASPQFCTRVVGVCDLASAISAAQQLIDQGVQLIELCGGFSEGEAAELRQQTGNKVPVGVVVYTPEQAQVLQQLFG
ncbi:MAG: DUF6506 family protein [Pseudomonadota bacterium]